VSVPDETNENQETMMRFTTLAAIVSLMIIAAGPQRLQGEPPRPAGTTRTDLLRGDLSIPGREVLQFRVELDPGSAFPMHSHPGEEVIYVLYGAIEYQVKGRAPLILRSGDVLFVPDGVVHSARNTGTEKAAELGTYIVEKGKPLVAFAK
jgi:quercetin dioxygenase-like cupin family protein